MDDQTVVAIQGVNFVNKGAELMLYAIIQSLKGKADILATDVKCGDFKARADLGLYHLPWLFTRKFPAKVSSAWKDTASTLVSVMPKNVRYATHILSSRDIGMVLDASGFAYSDDLGRLGERTTQFTADNVRKWKNQGTKIVFLPQAFGPFRSSQTREYASQIVRHSDLVFARDSVSLAHLRELAPESLNIRTAPDFTCLVPGVRPDRYYDIIGRPCVVPNRRMVDKTSPDIAAQYPSFLLKCLRLMIEKKLDPFLLIHEQHDVDLARGLQDQLPKSVQIIHEPDPVRIKGVLGQCSFVVSSRYHGLVSALSQGIPCLATGWSHKYQALLQDYGCPDSLLSVTASEEEIRSCIDLIGGEPGRSSLLAQLQSASREQHRLATDMWDAVYGIFS